MFALEDIEEAFNLYLHEIDKLYRVFNENSKDENFIESITLINNQNENIKKKKFYEIFNRRFTKIFKAVKLISNLSDKSYYDYNSDQVKEFIDILKNETDIISLFKPFKNEFKYKK